MWRLTACGLVLAAALVVAPSASANHSELIARWHLDTANDFLVTSDDSGHDLSGALNGGATLVSGGRFGNALDLPGGGDSQIDVSDNPVLEPTRVTVLAWVKLGSTPVGTHYVLAKGASGCSGSSYALATPAGGLAFHIYNGTSQVVSPNAGSGVWNDQWHAVAGTFDGATVRLYVDGVQVGGGTPTATSIAYGLSVDDLRIGNYPASNLCGGGLVFQGLIDEARVYNRALTGEEIAHLHGAGHSQPPNLPPPPVNTAAPSTNASADPHPGDDLTGSPGTWANSPSSFQYQWLRCNAEGGGCSDIAGATGSGYRVSEADLGSTLRLRVRATNASGSSGPADSTATKPVTAAPPPPPVARLATSPAPTCVGLRTAVDATGSTGQIVRYRFSYYERYDFLSLGRGVFSGTITIGANYRTVVIADGESPTAYHTFAANEFANIGENSFFVTTIKARRSPQDVVLEVFDAAGRSSAASVTVNFANGEDPGRREGCPGAAPRAPARWSTRDVRSTKLVKNQISAKLPCKSVNACGGALAVTLAGSVRAGQARKPVLLAQVVFSIPAGKTRRIRAALTRTGKRLLKRRAVRAKVTLLGIAEDGIPFTRAKTVVLRAKRKK